MQIRFTVQPANHITAAFAALVNASCTFEDARDKVTQLRAKGEVDTATAKAYIQAALLANRKAYLKDVDENGNAKRDTALMRAISRLMSATNPAKEQSGSAPERVSTQIRVPREIQELANQLWAACSEYEAAGKLASTALAVARAK